MGKPNKNEVLKTIENNDSLSSDLKKNMVEVLSKDEYRDGFSRLLGKALFDSKAQDTSKKNYDQHDLLSFAHDENVFLKNCCKIIKKL